MIKLSAIIITKNEEKNIAKCLSSISGLVDEIVIVDSGSSDRTIEIAKKYTTKIYYRAWDNNYSAQKNYALTKASGDWILSIDADERVSPELAEEIRHYFTSGQEEKYAGMLLPRKNYDLGRWHRHGEGLADFQLKLFRKESYFTRRVHESVVINGSHGRFTHPLIHDHLELTIKDNLRRIRLYSDLEVKALSEDGERPAFWKILVFPPLHFLRVYLWKRGFLDGWRGLLWAGLSAYAMFLKRYKFWRRMP